MRYTNKCKIDFSIALFGFNWLSNKAIDDSLSILDRNERDVIIKRYIRNLCLEEIGDTRGIGRERARQIESRALDKLKLYFNNKTDAEKFDIQHQGTKQNQNRHRRG